MSRRTLKHVSHKHRLTETDETDMTEFICDGCEMPGSGKRYRCGKCDYDMHERCATFPPALTSFFMHPHHDLTLSVMKPSARHPRVCDLCEEPVEGMIYRCGSCDFAVHPLCTLLPQHVQHVMHQPHRLVLSQSSPSRCMVCADTCEFWRYRCGICAVDIHISCVLAPVRATNQQSTVQQGNSGHGVPPATDGHNNDNNQPAARHRKRKIFYKILLNLITGVAANLVFGASADILTDL